MNTIDKYFDPILVTDLISKVKGRSTLANLSPQVPVAFNGNKEFIFSMDSELDIVAENGKKTHGGISLEPVIIRPIKFEYGARVSDEFIIATQEEKINILKAFNDGFAKKVAKALDIAAFHGLNPRTGETSAVVGENHFDSKVTQKVNYQETQINDNIEAAIALVEGAEHEVNALAIAPAGRSALAKLTTPQGVKMFPELAWGNAPSTINGLRVDVNATVYDKTKKDMVILGDFNNMFKWGYGKDVTFEVIQYGDPDNSGKDLKGYNQVYLRSEIFLGWGILDPKAFARVATA